MVKSLNLILLSFVGLAVSQDLSLDAVKNAFNAASIPSDLFINFNPTALLEVTFPQPACKPITLHAGIQLPRNATAGPPTFGVIGAVGNGPFVIATVDPDALTPQDPNEAQIRHFLGPNFFIDPSSDHDNVQHLVNNTPAISQFLQPSPPAGSDPHRYIFLMFNQPTNFNSQTLVTPTTSIELFNISAFAAATGLGDPIAGTFMLVGPDPTTA
ncbi:OV-16 antigen [Termitomyces sp. T112]|nr:OV-16 antigen [Termitomyces sp. T112]KNZ75258.1 OV-16 antigen [Termitomyces sp. J132]